MMERASLPRSVGSSVLGAVTLLRASPVGGTSSSSSSGSPGCTSVC